MIDCALIDGPCALLKDWMVDNVLSVSPQYATAGRGYILEEDAGFVDTGPMLDIFRQPLDVPQLQAAGEQQGLQMMQSSMAADAPLQQPQQLQHQASGGSSKGAAKARPKNTKRYKSQAQKDAHKRYRERKRQNITLMEAEVQEKLALLQQLEAENQELKSKHRVLQTSYKCSTDIMNIMKLLDGTCLQDLDSCSTDSLPELPDTPSAAGAPPTPAAAAVAAAAASSCQWRASSSNSVSICSRGGVEASTVPAATPLHLQAAELFSSGSSKQVLDPGLMLDPAALYQQEQQQQQQQSAAVAIKQEDTLNSSDIGTCRTHAAAAAPASAAALQSSPGGSSTRGHAHAALAGTRSTGSDAGAGGLHAILAEGQQQQQQQQQLFPAGSGSGGGMACSSGGDSKGQLELVGSVEQGMALYKDFLRQAQLLMLQQELGDPASSAAAEEELCQLTRAIISRMQPFLVAQGQGLVYDWNSRNLETHCYQDAPDELWPRVLSLMRLTPQQQQDALACNRMFSLCLSRLVDKRSELTAQYKVLQQQVDALAARCKQDGEAAGDVQLRAELMGASMEVLQHIAQNLAAYQSLDGVFSHSITSIISGAQMAVAMVHSYPFLPQWHQLMRHLQLQADAEAAQQQSVEPLPGRRSTRTGSRPSQVGLQHVVA